MARSLWVVPAFFVVGCALKTDERHTGSSIVSGSITDLTLASDHGVSIASSYPPSTEIKIAPADISCETSKAGERLTIDLGDAKAGTYTIVTGYPFKANLSPSQARASACPTDPNMPCHQLVRGGRVVVTRADVGAGGFVEGTFEVTFADGSLKGSFTAIRCN